MLALASEHGVCFGRRFGTRHVREGVGPPHTVARGTVFRKVSLRAVRAFLWFSPAAKAGRPNLLGYDCGAAALL